MVLLKIPFQDYENSRDDDEDKIKRSSLNWKMDLWYKLMKINFEDYDNFSNDDED